MEQNKFLKIFAIGAFLVLMFVSCWATVESLHLLLPSWPVVFFWAISIIFFVVASMGTKLIVDSLNQQIRVENRGWRLLGGILLLLVFWMVCSLPTNTHTFFYRSAIKDVLMSDLTGTKGKLQNLANEGEAKNIIDKEKGDFQNKIDVLFSKFAAEINNPGIPGWGDRAENALIELEGELGKIQRLKLRSNNLAGRQELIGAMSDQAEKLTKSKLGIYDTRLRNINRGLDKPEIQRLSAEIQLVQDKLSAISPKNDEPTEKTTHTLTQAYKIISSYSDVLINEFEKSYPDNIRMAKEDKRVYSDVSKTERMRSVIEVWKDFFAGKYAGRGFLFWIVIAALVDIAGFIFFDIAFRNED